MIVPGVRGTVVHLVRDVITVDPLRRESQGQSGVQILEKPRLKLFPSFFLSLSLFLSLFLSFSRVLRIQLCATLGSSKQRNPRRVEDPYRRGYLEQGVYTRGLYERWRRPYQPAVVSSIYHGPIYTEVGSNIAAASLRPV